VVLIISLWFGVGASASAACVEGHLTVQKEYARSVGVFTGTVISERRAPSADADREPDGTMYQVRVDETLRGRVNGRVDLFSENSTGRYPMEIGTKVSLVRVWRSRPNDRRQLRQFRNLQRDLARSGDRPLVEGQVTLTCE
jgi:hypothetical protein